MNQDLANLHALFVAVFFVRKSKRKPTLNAMLSKVQFTFKVNSIHFNALKLKLKIM
jgi:hypothetical protein